MYTTQEQQEDIERAEAYAEKAKELEILKGQIVEAKATIAEADFDEASDIEDLREYSEHLARLCREYIEVDEQEF